MVHDYQFEQSTNERPLHVGRTGIVAVPIVAAAASKLPAITTMRAVAPAMN